MRSTSIRVAALAAAAALLAAACGDDDSGSGPELNDREAAYADAIAQTYQESSEAPAEVSDEQASCIASSIVSVVGVERFEDADVEPEDISADIDLDETFGGLGEEEATDIGGAIGDCIDLQQLVIDGIGTDLPDEAVECLRENLDEEVIQEFVVASLVAGGDEVSSDVQTRMLSVLQECPEALGGE